MKLAPFERRAQEMWREIPEEFTHGVDGLVVHREALPHPVQADIYTLGMCLTEPYPSDWTGPETTRSVLALYWGSFRKLAELDPDFDWEEELWETITHELRHHLESLAREDQLERVDYAMDETFKREAGEPFDPWYWQSGDPVADGVYRVEYDWYLERRWREGGSGAGAAAGGEGDVGAPEIEFAWHGERYAIPAPDEPADLHFIRIHGVEVGPGILELVLVREAGFGERLRRWMRRSEAPLSILESDADARRVDP
jgi:hypothetical protein